MPTYQRIGYGCLGALTPVLLNLLAIDFETAFADFKLIKFAGYCFRVILLCALGAIVAMLHKSEKSPVKMFELGMAAPALLTALLNASNVNANKDHSQAVSTALGNISWISSAYADEPIPVEVKPLAAPQSSATQQFFQGFLGSSPKNIWFVIAGTYTNEDNAKRAAQKINTEQGIKSIKAAVYTPIGDNRYFAVVIGSYLTLGDAKALQAKAVAAGLAKDTYLWRYPIEDPNYVNKSLSPPTTK